MDKLAYTIRNLNLLDLYVETEGTRHVYRRVYFYANMENQKRQNYTISLIIEDGFIQAGGSMCLPTNGQGEHAAAYRRAEEFLRLSGMRDSRPSSEEL